MGFVETGLLKGLKLVMMAPLLTGKAAMKTALESEQDINASKERLSNALLFVETASLLEMSSAMMETLLI